jgi:ketosteroid isomerase-like protein
MSQEDVEIVKRANALLNEGDWDAMTLLSDPDIVFCDLRNAADAQQVLTGSASVRALLAQWSEVFDDFGAEVYEYLDAEPYVICDARWYATANGVRRPLPCARPTSTRSATARSLASHLAMPQRPRPLKPWGCGSRQAAGYWAGDVAGERGVGAAASAVA